MNSKFLPLAKMALPVAVAAIVMGVACVIQGQWSERWGTFPELQVLSAQMDEIPVQIGEWQGVDAAKSSEKVLKIAGAEGEFARIYKNANGNEVRVSMICGRLQDIFYHTPDRCYPAAGFEMLGEPQPEVFELPGGGEAQFFTTQFEKSEPTGTHHERGYWTWSGDGTWKAPKNPKLAFASQQHALYKLYVFATVPPQAKAKASDSDFCSEFIRTFIPALDRALRPALEKAGRIKTTESTPVETAAAPPVETATSP